MRPIPFPLESHAHGEAVADLHRALEEIGLRVTLEDIRRRSIGTSTQRALQSFQLAHGLTGTGAVDQDTATRLNELALERGLFDDDGDALPKGSGRVRGIVRDASGIPLPGIRIRAVDRGLTEARELGRGRTANDGSFEMVYGLDAGKPVDLAVLALDRQRNLLGASSVFLSAPVDHTIEIVVDGGKVTLPTELERVAWALETALENEDVALEDLEGADLAIAEGRAGLAPGIALAMIQADVLEGRCEIPADVFYGLFRAGIPLHLASILARDPVDLTAALDQSVAAGIVAPSALRHLKRARKPLAAMRDEALGIEIDGALTVPALASLAGLDAEATAALIATVAETGRLPDDPALASSLTWGHLAGGDPEVADRLRTQTDDDPAALLAWTDAMWDDTVGEDAAPAIRGRLHAAWPAGALAHALGDRDPAAAADLAAHPRRDPGAFGPDRLRRLTRLAGDVDDVVALWDLGVDSALGVVATGTPKDVLPRAAMRATTVARRVLQGAMVSSGPTLLDPAAYLVTLIERLVAHRGSLDRLLAQRPDLAQVRLDDTRPVPHAQRVDEVLGACVPDEAFADVYPWSLPFDPIADAVGAWLEAAGVTRVQLLEATHPADDPTAVTCRLGLSAPEADIITGTTRLGAPSWGVQRLSDLATVDVMLDRCGVTSEILDQILATATANPNGAITRADGQLEGLTPATTARVQRFVRAMRALSLSPEALDAAATTYDRGRLSATLLAKLATRARLSRVPDPILSEVGFDLADPDDAAQAAHLTALLETLGGIPADLVAGLNPRTDDDEIVGPLEALAARLITVPEGTDERGDALVDWMSTHLDLDADLTRLLLGESAALADRAFVVAKSVSARALKPQRHQFHQLVRAAALIRSLGGQPAEIAHLVTRGPAVGLMDLTDLPTGRSGATECLRGWRWLAEALCMERSAPGVLDVLGGDFVGSAAQRTGSTRDDIDVWMAHLGLTPSMAALVTLTEVTTIPRRLGVSAETALRWSGPPTAELVSELAEAIGPRPEVTEALSHQIRRARLAILGHRVGAASDGETLAHLFLDVDPGPVDPVRGAIAVVEGFVSFEGLPVLVEGYPRWHAKRLAHLFPDDPARHPPDPRHAPDAPVVWVPRPIGPEVSLSPTEAFVDAAEITPRTLEAAETRQAGLLPPLGYALVAVPIAPPTPDAEAFRGAWAEADGHVEAGDLESAVDGYRSLAQHAGLSVGQHRALSLRIADAALRLAIAEDDPIRAARWVRVGARALQGGPSAVAPVPPRGITIADVVASDGALPGFLVALEAEIDAPDTDVDLDLVEIARTAAWLAVPDHPQATTLARQLGDRMAALQFQVP